MKIRKVPTLCCVERIYLECVWILFILLKTENNKKIFSDYCSLIKILSICTVHIPQIVQQVLEKKKKKQMQGRFHPYPNQHLISFVAKGWGAHITINNSNNLKWLFYLLLSLPYIYCYFYLFMQFGNVQMLLSMCFVAIHWFWLGLFRLDWSLTTRPNCPMLT